jgi:hypothetical protein
MRSSVLWAAETAPLHFFNHAFKFAFAWDGTRICLAMYSFISVEWFYHKPSQVCETMYAPMPKLIPPAANESNKIEQKCKKACEEANENASHQYRPHPNIIVKTTTQSMSRENHHVNLVSLQHAW